MINCANGEDLEFGDELTKQLDGDLDLKRLGIQLTMLPVFIEEWGVMQRPLMSVFEIFPKLTLSSMVINGH